MDLKLSLKDGKFIKGLLFENNPKLEIDVTNDEH